MTRIRPIFCLFHFGKRFELTAFIRTFDDKVPDAINILIDFAFAALSRSAAWAVH
jgi:hypothetical protein